MKVSLLVAWEKGKNAPFCGDCEHWGVTNSGRGECRKRPPIPHLIKIIPIRYESKYPWVLSKERICDEFLQERVEHES